MKSERYKCECGAILSVRQIVKNGVKNCPHCRVSLPTKQIMKLYRRAPERIFRLDCMCGKVYMIVPPSGNFKFDCPKCGRNLLTIRTGIVNGVALPRIIESVQQNKIFGEQT